MFKVGERRKFSWGSFTIEKEFDVDFKFCWDEPIRPGSRFFRIIKIYRLMGKTEEYLAISDKNHIFKFPRRIALEKIK